ncbi:sugar ABC transporter substrate-binding protein (plasmid) [Haloferacaceae archaeon DSL9]
MQEVSRRTVLKGITGGTVASSLAGCIGSGIGGAGDAVTFWAQFWQSESHQPYAEWFAETIEERTNREFELTEYAYSDLRQNVITGGRTGTPAVIEGVIEHPGDYVGADLLEPLTDKTDEISHFDGFIDSAIEAFEFQDELWGLPYTGNGRALVYRKDVLEEYGYEEPPSDASEFMELAGAITADDDMNGFHLTTERGEVRVTQEFLSHVYQHADGLYEWNGTEWELQVDVDVFEGILDTFYYGLFYGDQPACSIEQRGAGWESNDEGYARGDHAMIHCGPWIETFDDTEERAEILGERTSISLLSKLSGAGDGTYMEVKPIMINAHSEDTDTALEAASLFTSPESLNEFKKVDPGSLNTPVHEDVEPAIDDEDYDAFTDAFENGIAPAPIKWGPVREAIYDAIENVIYQESDPAEAASTLERALTEADISLGER